MASIKSMSSRPSLILFGLLLGILCVFYWSGHHTKAPVGVLDHRSVEIGKLEGLGDVVPSNKTIVARDSYQCGPGNPCSNGACCGKSGYCGYGPDYCGDGCISNCDAVAECGKFAKTPGKKCPLNTCCSQYGFCGTTEEFCGTGCQSNCVLHPKPPNGRSSNGILQNKVIGYYESWGRKACHRVEPTGLPLDALSHINYAFAYIEPSSYQVVTMDTATPSSLFKEVANLKSIKQDLTVFVSIGGWTFSNNNTATQPLFGEIAADASKRQTFANNLVHFMKQYGFDGVDLDWEYPGAPDRGGQDRDTHNYVLLLKTLRETFDASPDKYGLSFTAPSSYWYLRWFDLSGMIKYADWINVMTYDLHGVWDAHDPIGSIVQGHTNLTEIKSALELYWRVDIPPSKIVMGFGFYGRSFTLADPSCSKPGCPFSGASNPGPCSDTGGMLAYYEIQQVLHGATGKKRAPTTLVHDKEAAVNYFTFDGNQWVSYDDGTTFKQKVDWADGVGLGGALIWASDLDDDKYKAHSGLLGRDIQYNSYVKGLSKALSSPQSVIQDLSGENGQKCFKFKKHCLHLNDKKAMKDACGHSYSVVGWDDAGCGSGSCHCGKPICCPVDSAPKHCMWRGDDNGGGASSDCSTQCRPGEININGIKSSWGGGFLNDGNTDRCGRGYKVFCCPDAKYGEVTKDCGYAKCRSSCPKGKKAVFKNYDNCWFGGQQYCCPDDNPIWLEGCHWTAGEGAADCANAKCNATELEVDRAVYGDQGEGCNWHRKKAMCCTVKEEPAKPLTCSADLCKLDSKYCLSSDGNSNLIQRSLEVSYGNGSGQFHALERRADKDFEMIIHGVTIEMLGAAFPSIGRLFGIANARQILRRFIRMIPYYCLGPSIHEGTIAPGPSPPGLGGLNTEHPIDVLVIREFVKAAGTGILASGRQPGIAPITMNFWEHELHASNGALANRPAIGGPNGPRPDNPNDRIMNSFGSTKYPYPFMAVDGKINIAKAQIMDRKNPVDLDLIDDAAATAVEEDTENASDELLSLIRTGFATFEYLRHPDFVVHWNAVRQQIRLQLEFVEDDVGVPNLVQWWDMFTDDYFSLVQQEARDWALLAINAAFNPIREAQQNGVQLVNGRRTVAVLRRWLQEIREMVLPPDTSMRPSYPPAPGGLGGEMRMLELPSV